MTAKIKKISEVGTKTGVARLLAVPTQTLDSACTAGKIETTQLGDGTSVVSIASARAWAASDRRPGRRATT